MNLALWQQTALPGDICEYHRGFLAKEAVDLSEVRELRHEAAGLWLTGHYELTQRRHGVDDYSYYVIKRLTHDPESRRWYFTRDDIETRGWRPHAGPRKTAA